MNDDRFTVLTGGPGAGKTSVIDELRSRGYAGSQEAGRAIIIDQQLIGGNALHTGDRALFAELMLGWELRSYRLALDDPADAVFFDRAIPELTGYYRLVGLPVPAHVIEAARRFRYRPRVFVAPPWPEIYATDAERGQDYAEAVATCEAVTAAYAEHGYELIELPFAPVSERADFVLASR